MVAAQVIKLEFALNDAMVRLKEARKPSDIDAAARQLADIFGMASVTVGVAGTASAVGGALPKVAGLVDDVAAGAKALGDTPSGLAPVTTGGTLAHRLPPAQSRTPPTFTNPVPPEALVPLAVKDGIYRVPLNRQMEWGGQSNMAAQNAGGGVIPSTAKPVTQETLEHVFHGHVRNGRASGFHSNRGGMQAVKETKIIAGTETPLDKNGVYEAKVTVQGVIKQFKSSFFPDKWTKVEVVNAINEAYATRAPIPGQNNGFIGVSSSGVKVKMYLKPDGSISTAFPLYKK